MFVRLKDWRRTATRYDRGPKVVLSAVDACVDPSVWAHNSHIGDARATAMGRGMGELNLGQLCRERFGKDAALIGFGTATGTVAAADDWGDEMEVMKVRPPLPGSWEALCHATGIPRFLTDFGGAPKGLPDRLLERFIGVIYRPETERWSHYAEASLAGQFDAWLWFDETRPVQALPTATVPGGDETFPFGL